MTPRCLSTPPTRVIASAAPTANSNGSPVPNGNEMSLSAAAFKPQVRDALAAYLIAVADDELIIGHRHSEWTGFAPDIESDVALSSIAQEEIGHARLFYERACDLIGGDPDHVAFGRASAEFRNAVLTERPNGDWGYSMVRLFLYDRADHVRLDVLASGALRPLADLASTVRREEKYHLMFGEQWLRRLASATEASRGRMQQALDRAWPEALGVFEPVSGQEELGAGVVPVPPVEQLARWRQSVAAVLESVGLRLPAANGGNGAGGRTGRTSAALRA